MNILILGSGGREHSLAWAVLQNPKCDRLIVAPGNAGIAQIAECAGLDIMDGGAVVTFAEEESIDFVIVGPEAPLAVGVADRLREAGILTFGPSEGAARLEASKSFTKEICDAANAPTAGYGHFTDADAARAYVARSGAPCVVKADGLAAGKGVIIAMTEIEALAAIDDMFGGAFGGAGAEVVIEEFVRAKKPRCSCSATAQTSCRSERPRTTSVWAKVTPGSIPAAWGPTRPPPFCRPRSRPAPWTKSSAPPWPKWPGAGCPFRAFSMQA